MITYLVIGGTVALLAFLYWFANRERRAGEDAFNAALGESNAAASKRIADAVASVPSDSDALLDRLSKPGGGKL